MFLPTISFSESECHVIKEASHVLMETRARREISTGFPAR